MASVPLPQALRDRNVPFSLARDGRKVCSKCCAEKSVSEFYRDRRKQDGLRTPCKACHAKSKPYTTEVRRALPCRQPDYRKKQRRLAAEAAGRRYRPKPDQRMRALLAKIRSVRLRLLAQERADLRAIRDAEKSAQGRCPECVEQRRARDRERYRLERDANPERMRANWRRNKHVRRLQRKDQADGTLEREGFDDLYRTARTCLYCGCKLTRREPDQWRATDATLDHLNPLSRGGVHGVVNAVIACARCNFSKHDLPLTEWLERIDPKRADAVRRLYRKRYGVPPEQQALL